MAHEAFNAVDWLTRCNGGVEVKRFVTGKTALRAITGAYMAGVRAGVGQLALIAEAHLDSMGREAMQILKAEAP